MKSKLHFFNEEAQKAFFLTLSLALASFATAQTQVVGTLIGTNGSWANNPANTMTAAVDGNVNTFFDAPVSASYIGYDLGVNNQVSLSSVKFYPRNSNTTDLPDRMGGNKIYGTNTLGQVGTTNGTLLYTFPPADTGAHLAGQYDYRAIVTGGTTLVELTFTASATSYRYIYMYSMNGCNVGEIQFLGTSSTLGLEDKNIENNKFKLYPNPSTAKFFNIDLGSEYVNDAVEVKVYDGFGNLVLEQTLEANAHRVNHNLDTGVYIVKVGKSAVKLIVQ